MGQKSAEGVKLVSVERDAATFEIGGKRMTLGMGHARMMTSDPVRESTVLTADVRGHFYVYGQLNARSVRFVVDTGATLVSIPASEARRLSIDYQKGQKALMRTANGNATGYLVKLDTVSVGGVTIYGVDAVVIEGNGLTSTLLGMSFLNRMDMKREGDIMTLTKRWRPSLFAGFRHSDDDATTGQSWLNDSTLSGWSLFRQPGPGTALTTYAGGTGSNNTGSFYSFGAARRLNVLWAG